MKLQLSTGWVELAPIITVGSYHAGVSPENFFGDWLLDYDDYITTEEKEFIEINMWDNFDYDKFEQIIGDSAITCFEKFFNEKYVKDVVDVKIIPNSHYIWSPKEYNFADDELRFDVEVSKEDIRKIADYVLTEGDKFFDWIYKTYKSYDGFCSFMPYCKEDFLKIVNDENINSDKAASVLEMLLVYLYSKEHNFDLKSIDFYNSYQADIWEYITSNFSMESFIRNEEVIHILERAFDMICNHEEEMFV